MGCFSLFLVGVREKKRREKLGKHWWIPEINVYLKNIFIFCTVYLLDFVHPMLVCEVSNQDSTDNSKLCLLGWRCAMAMTILSGDSQEPKTLYLPHLRFTVNTNLSFCLHFSISSLVLLMLSSRLSSVHPSAKLLFPRYQLSSLFEIWLKMVMSSAYS